MPIVSMRLVGPKRLFVLILRYDYITPGSTMALLLQIRRANYIKPAPQPSRFILGMKSRICGIDIPKEDGILCLCNL